MAANVGEADFQQQVVERSREVPVVVDFWAEWCGPCRTLGPALEKAVAARGGRVELAKVDTEANQGLARTFQIQSIPAVKAFKDGKVVEEFVGAIPPAAIEEFLDKLAPSEAEEIASGGDEESLRKALEVDPRHAPAAISLARLLMERGENDEAAELLSPFPNDFVADGLAARAELAEQLDQGESDQAIRQAFEAWDADNQDRALELLQDALAADPGRRDQLRRIMVAIFTELGADHPLAREHRRRLAAALN